MNTETVSHSPGMNVGLMKAVASKILNEPRNYDQQTWCGTVCCIAGHTQIIIGGAKHTFDGIGGWQKWQSEIQEALGLNDEQANNLFWCPEDWPEPHRTAYLTSRPFTFERARGSHDRIMHMVRTGK